MSKNKTEYFPQGGVHLKHSAISPSTSRTVSGIPPLTIHSSGPCSIKQITVFGNTIDGAGVGDRTVNLFDLTNSSVASGTILEHSEDRVTAKGNASSTPGTNKYSNGWLRIYSAELPANSQVRFAANINFTDKHSSFDNKIQFRLEDSNNNYLSGTVRNYDNPGWYSYSAVTDSADTYHILISLNSSTVEISKAQISIGSSARDYEPYGCKIPVTVTGSGGDIAETVDLYTPAPLYDAEDSISRQISVLPKHKPVLSVDTAVPPSSVTVTYTK